MLYTGGLSGLPQGLLHRLAQAPRDWDRFTLPLGLETGKLPEAETQRADTQRVERTATDRSR